jgi:hypothetical protein
MKDNERHGGKKKDRRKTGEGFWETTKDNERQKEGHTGLVFQHERGSDTYKAKVIHVL